MRIPSNIDGPIIDAGDGELRAMRARLRAAVAILGDSDLTPTAQRLLLAIADGGTK